MASSVIGALRVMLGMDTAEFEAGTTKAQREVQRLERRLQRTAASIGRVGRNLTLGLTAPLAAFGVSAFNAASDAAELQSAFNQTFGDMADEMNAWAEETGNALGRSTQSMQQLANTFGIFFNQAAPTREEAAKMSQTFAVLAQDLASFYNVTEEDALAKLRSGLSGEAEPLRDFGVFLSAAAVEAKALEMGLAKSKSEITEQDKILARYNLILEATANAQGDVARTSDGTANQMRRAQAAFQELQVTIGTKLLPVITPLIEKLGGLLDRFSQLPEGMQTFVVAAGAVAAALGPVLLGVSGLVSAFTSLLPVFSGVVSLFSGGAGLAGLAAALGPVLPIVAGVAAAGALLYANWDKIRPLLEELWTTAQETLGPPLRELVATLSETLRALWEGPLGAMVRGAGELLLQFGTIGMRVLGSQLIEALRIAIDVATNVFDAISVAVRGLNALLSGDFSGAWQAALQVVDMATFGMVTAAQRLYEGVRDWLQARLGGVFDWVRDKVEQVESTFAWLYNEVVGNSHVPDMVDGIDREMRRLESVMVLPVTKATTKAEERFRDMAANVHGILRRIFPEIARLQDFRDDAAAIAASDLPEAQKALAQSRLRYELAGVDPRGREDDRIDVGAPDLDRLETLMGRVPEELRRMSERMAETNKRIGDSFVKMADQALGALDGLLQGIKSGNFFDIMRGALRVLDGIAGIFTGGKGFNLFGSIFGAGDKDLPGFATGGSMRLGGVAGIDRNVLSLNGTPIARVSRGETMTVRPANDRGGRLNVTVTMDRSTGALGAFVRDEAGAVVAQAAPALVEAGGRAGVARMIRARERSLR